MNDRLGEFWYRLNLTALPASATVLDPISCAVGTWASVAVVVENPLGKAVVLAAAVSNPTNYSVSPSSLTLGPYGSDTVSLQYTPSSLTGVEATTLTLSNAELGDWEYIMEGHGELPGVMDEVCPEASVDEPASSMISFRNPFPEAMTVSIVLRADGVGDGSGGGDGRGGGGGGGGGAEEEGPTGPFTLLLRKSDRVAMGPFSTLQIPVSFRPRAIAERKGTVEVRGATASGGRPLLWAFPLRGLVNAPPHPKAFVVRCAAKASARAVLELPLKSIAGMRGPEAFDLEVVVPPGSAKLVGASLTLNPVATTISDPFEPVRYHVVFEPMRPFTTSVQLFVKRVGSGGRWPFELQLDATEPEPDDRIVVEAALKTTGAVAFTLSNRFEAYAPFQAFFSSDSSLTLAVAPHNGLLAPASAGGTQISVTFSPTEYGSRQRGRLVILTEETQWSYEVSGALPKDKLPTNHRPGATDWGQGHKGGGQKGGSP